MSRQATSAPSRASRSATARPMPRRRAAPVTRATFPAIPSSAIRAGRWHHRREKRKSHRRERRKPRQMTARVSTRPYATDRSMVRAVFLALAVLSMLAAPAMARRSYTVRVPAFEVPAGKNREICVYVPMPAKKVMDVGEVRIRNRGGTPPFATHPLIVYAYHGSAGSVARTEGQNVDDTAWLNFGSGTPSDPQIVATSQGPDTRWITPHGTALELEPAAATSGKMVIGLVLNSHWINADSVSHKGRAKITFVTRKAKEVKRPLKPIFEVVANGFIDVPPGGTRQVGWSWGPSRVDIGGFLGGSQYPKGPACVTMLTRHMHKRGALFRTDPIDPARNTHELNANTL